MRAAARGAFIGLFFVDVVDRRQMGGAKIDIT
jgi:hypothetical protein